MNYSSLDKARKSLVNKRLLTSKTLCQLVQGLLVIILITINSDFGKIRINT